MSDPSSVGGWHRPADPGKPVSRFTPLRECLSILNPAGRYHPLYNPLVFRAGCP